jgi:MoaA/NifB/PqqE/SkfB family radical SAM enzyme
MAGGPARPLVVVWRITEACDLSCWFCEYNRHAYGSRRPRRSARASDVLAFGKVLADYAASPGRTVLVSWLGGEPLVWPPLVEVGRRLKHDYGLQLSLTTNGERLGRPGLIQHLAENYTEVTISVDGTADFHDAGRGAPGLWEQLRVAVGELRERRARQGYGPLLRANGLLMRSNLHVFERLCEALAGWGVEEVTFNALGGQPPGPNYARERLTPADIDWLRSALPGIRQRLASRGLTVRGGARYLGRLASSAGGEMVPVLDCHPGAEFLFVDAQGRLAPCSFTTEGYGVPISEIRSGADLEQLPARFAERRRLALMPACHDCPSTQVFGKFDLAEAP